MLFKLVYPVSVLNFLILKSYFNAVLYVAFVVTTKSNDFSFFPAVSSSGRAFVKLITLVLLSKNFIETSPVVILFSFPVKTYLHAE